MRFYLISLIFMLLVGTGFAAIGEDFVSFNWPAGTNSSADNGGGATAAAWQDGANPDDFIGTQGLAISLAGAWDDSETGCTVTDNGGGLLRLTSVGDFDDVESDTICRVNFAATYTDGYFLAIAVDADSIDLAGTTYSADTTADCRAGGAIDGLGEIINTDLADASTVNCDVLIKGNETAGADIDIAAGGGTDTTLLQFIGVDSSWVPISLTATSGWPVLTMQGFTLKLTSDGITVKTLSVTSTDGDFTVLVTGEYVSLLSNTIANTGAGRAYRANGQSTVCMNCSFTANSATTVIQPDRGSVSGCTIKQLGAGDGVQLATGFAGGYLGNNIIYSSGGGGNGIFIDALDSAANPVVIVNNTIDDWDDCIHMDELPDVADDVGSVLIANNILSDWDTFGINKTDADDQGPVIINNAFWDAQATGNPTNLGNLPVLLSITLSGDPYTTQGTDYSLNDTAGAGAAVRAAGFPGARVDGNNTGFNTVGALDAQGAAGGGQPILGGSVVR